MGKGKNKNKNKSPGKSGDEEAKSQQAGDGFAESDGRPADKDQTVNTRNSPKSSPIEPSTKSEPITEDNSEIANGQQSPTIPTEPQNVVDQSLAAVQSSWRLWLVMGTVAAVIAVMGHVTVEEQETLLIEKGVALTKTRARVFQLIGDLSNYGRWFPGIDKFDALDAVPMGAGKQFSEVINIPLYGEMRYLNTVVGYESPHYVTFISDSWLKLRAEIMVDRRDSTTTPTSVKYKLYSRCNTYLCRYVALPAVRMMYSNRVRQAMFNLRFTFTK